MRSILLVGLGGCVGAIGRYTIGEFVKSRIPAYPHAGTFVVNMIGCLLIGFVMELTTNASPPWRLVIVTGCLGALTTFSTFGLETVRLLEDSKLNAAAANVIGNIAVGLPAVWLGIKAAGFFAKN